jgi:frataxin-like iron-binding protein CyaY
VTLYIMSSTNDTTRLSVASDISTYKFEMGRSDWSSVRRTHAIK